MEALPLAFTTGWASGINAYACVLILGLLGRFGGVDEVPVGLTGNAVLIAAGALFVFEFVADKIPYIDSAWDAISTLIRPTVGAIIAALLKLVDASTLNQAFIATTGGLVALLSHPVKSSLRLAINTSPEPATNIAASSGEDVAVIGVVSLAVFHPTAALIIAGILLLLGLIGVYFAFRAIRRGLAGSGPGENDEPSNREQCRLMARVIVIGAGLAGLATAVRLAKLGHQVTVCEERSGSAARSAGSRPTVLLGRRSSQYYAPGRAPRPVPQERPADREPGATGAHHRTAAAPVRRRVDPRPAGRRPCRPGGGVDGPGRGEGRAAVDLARRRIRRDLADPPQDLARTTPAGPPPTQGDPRAQALAVAAARRPAEPRRRAGPRSTAVLRDAHGSDPKLTPGYVGVWSYLERTFGRWTVQGGFGVLADALAQRASERKIDIHTTPRWSP